MGRKYDLEERLIAFAIRMMEIAEQLPSFYYGHNLHFYYKKTNRFC